MYTLMCLERKLTLVRRPLQIGFRGQVFKNYDLIYIYISFISRSPRVMAITSIADHARPRRPTNKGCLALAPGTSRPQAKLCGAASVASGLRGHSRDVAGPLGPRHGPPGPLSGPQRAPQQSNRVWRGAARCAWPRNLPRLSPDPDHAC